MRGGYEHLGNDPDSDDDTQGDGAEDIDGDGLTALQEQAAGSHPLAPDTDGDTIGDADEVAGGTDPGQVDSDADGLTDDAELRLGLDPMDADSDDDTILDGAETITSTIDGPDPDVAVEVTGTGDVGGEIEVRSLAGVPDLLAAPGQAADVYDVSVTEQGLGALDSASVTLPYDEGAVGDEADVRLYTQDHDTGIWVPAALVGDQIIDPVANTVTATVAHFSRFTVVDQAATEAYWSGISNCAVADPTDTDGDDLADCEETGGMTDPFGETVFADPALVDTDGDGLDDGDEVSRLDPTSIVILGVPLDQLVGASVIYRVIADPSLSNTDGDPDSALKTSDLDEVAEGTDPRSIDTDLDGVGDATELEREMDPLSRDTDGDTFEDSFEVSASNQGFDPLLADDGMTPERWAGLFAMGAACGDFRCGEAADADTIPYLMGSVTSSIFGQQVADARDILGSLANFDLIGAGMNLVGVVPIFGDGAQIVRKVVRFAARLTPAQIGRLVQAIGRSDLPNEVADPVVDAITDAALARLKQFHPDVDTDFLKASGRNLDDLAKAAAHPLATISKHLPIDDWRDGEDFIRGLLPISGPKGRGFAIPPATKPRRARIVDAWNADFKIARESKVGWQGDVAKIVEQIEKDARLKSDPPFPPVISQIEWHFFPSAASNSVGAHPKIIEALQLNGIPYVIYLPFVPGG